MKIPGELVDLGQFWSIKRFKGLSIILVMLVKARAKVSTRVKLEVSGERTAYPINRMDKTG